MTNFGPWPLMKDNIQKEDLDAVCELVAAEDPILTQSQNVRLFEEEWSKWLGVKYSVYVNSGSSANLLTLAALKEWDLQDRKEIVLSPLNWVSDVAAVLHTGHEPVFVDIDLHTLGLHPVRTLEAIGDKTRAVLLTHILGYNALTEGMLQTLNTRRIYLLEDACESHGATFWGRKVGTFGVASNFSFYYAHHLSTVEGGMVCTDWEDLADLVRVLRSHGLVRESKILNRKGKFRLEFPDLNPDFIFAYPAYNMRGTEFGGVIGRSQLKRLDNGIQKRTENLLLFLKNLDPKLYFTEFATAGSSSYALTLLLRNSDLVLRDRVESALRNNQIEFRRGMSGGGNQLRQPYLRERFGERYYERYPNTEHVHHYGWYVGNYPALERDRILQLCEILNGLERW